MATGNFRNSFKDNSHYKLSDISKHSNERRSPCLLLNQLKFQTSDDLVQHNLSCYTCWSSAFLEMADHLPAEWK